MVTEAWVPADKYRLTGGIVTVQLLGAWLAELNSQVREARAVAK